MRLFNYFFKDIDKTIENSIFIERNAKLYRGQSKFSGRYNYKI